MCVHIYIQEKQHGNTMTYPVLCSCTTSSDTICCCIFTLAELVISSSRTFSEVPHVTVDPLLITDPMAQNLLILKNGK